MKRTIEMRNGGYVFYHGTEIDYMLWCIRKHFKLRTSQTHKYVITITESKTGEYSFLNRDDDMYELYIGDKCIGEICKRLFNKLFFKPWVRKRYNISVRKVEIKNR